MASDSHSSKGAGLNGGHRFADSSLRDSLNEDALNMDRQRQGLSSAAGTPFLPSAPMGHFSAYRLAQRQHVLRLQKQRQQQAHHEGSSTAENAAAA
jgi:hypothetical protein